MSRPAYMGLGSTSAFPGPAYDFPGRNMFFPGRNSRLWAGMGCFKSPRPAYGLAGPIPAVHPSLPRAWAVPRHLLQLGHAPACSPSRPHLSSLHAWAAPHLGRRFLLRVGRAQVLGRGWASVPEQQQSRHAGLPASWAAPRQARPAWAGILLGCAGQAMDDPVVPASVPAAAAS
jgi:hypothetical protein